MGPRGVGCLMAIVIVLLSAFGPGVETQLGLKPFTPQQLNRLSASLSSTQDFGFPLGPLPELEAQVPVPPSA
ncbi:MAG: hypothetical protein ABR498_03000, partial [Candidatus Dormibacteria bacterium]